MKQVLLLGMVFLLACNSKQENETHTHHMSNEKEMAEKSKKFEGVEFASKRDTICNMPISAGIVDTLVLDSKVYGFCSDECKEEFSNTLKEQNKR